MAPSSMVVIPAKAGIHAVDNPFFCTSSECHCGIRRWIPAGAGMIVSLTRGEAGEMLAKETRTVGQRAVDDVNVV